MAEARRNIYGQLFQIREQEYTQEVSKAPADTYVIVHLSANTYEHTYGQAELEGVSWGVLQRPGQRAHCSLVLLWSCRSVFSVRPTARF
jgi:hypothetical protein